MGRQLVVAGATDENEGIKTIIQHSTMTSRKEFCKKAKAIQMDLNKTVFIKVKENKVLIF